jgi:hypothetical protein
MGGLAFAGCAEAMIFMAEEQARMQSIHNVWQVALLAFSDIDHIPEPIAA